MSPTINKFSTQRGNDAIEVNGFKFRKQRTMLDGRVSWRCLNNNCPYTLKTNAQVQTVLETSGQHDHPAPDLASASTVINDFSVRQSTPLCTDKLPSTPVSCKGISSPQRTMCDMGVNTPTARTVSNNESPSLRAIELLQQRDDMIAYSQDLKVQIESLQKQVETQREQIKSVTLEFERENGDVRSQLRAMSVTIETLEADNNALRNENSLLRDSSNKNKSLRNKSKNNGSKQTKSNNGIKPSRTSISNSIVYSDAVVSKECEPSPATPNLTVHHYADSQGRDVGRHFKRKSNLNFTSFVKPGARFRDVMPDSLTAFGGNDVLVIQGGTNDVSRNEAKDVLIALRKSLVALYGTNVVVISIPHRFDLADWS